MDIEEMDSNYSIKSLHRALQVLKIFSSERTSLSMTEIHKITKLSKPSLQRILSTLVYEGFLFKEEKTKNYRLGIELYFLGNLVLKDSSILDIALPVMEKIRDITGEVVMLSTRYKDQRVCIGSCKGTHELTTNSYVGQYSPLYIGASGKTLLAYLPEKEINDYLNKVEMEKMTPYSITDKDLLKEELKRIKEQGYAISNGERLKGVMGISTPIFYSHSNVIAALAIVIPDVRSEEYKKEELIKLMKNGAEEISNKQGRRNFPEE